MMHHTSHRALSACVAMFVTAGSIGCRSAAPPIDAALSAADLSGIRATLETYRTSWLSADNEGVLKTLTADAVLLPHHGDPPVVGLTAIRAHWFAPGPPTTIDELTITVDDIVGRGTSAHVWGHDTVRWTTTTNGVPAKFGNGGTYLNVMVKGTDDVWRIRAHMWDDPATQPVKTP